jgi:hypothetical protein
MVGIDGGAGGVLGTGGRPAIGGALGSGGAAGATASGGVPGSGRNAPDAGGGSGKASGCSCTLAAVSRDTGVPFFAIFALLTRAGLLLLRRRP